MDTILIIDDDHRVLKGYKISLEDELQDAIILTASNDIQAIELISSRAIDVIITDLIMDTPNSGITILEHAKNKDPLIMVIIITADGTNLDRKHAFEQGAFDCLEKSSPGVKTADELAYKTKSALFSRKKAMELIASQRQIDFFRRYFDPLIFKKITENPKILEPENRVVTIAFWDIRGFSALSEQLKGSNNLIASFLKEFFEMASDVIFEHNGIVDKFIGDGVMAIFGAFEEGEANEDKNAILALEAAIKLRTKFNAIFDKWANIWQRASAKNINIGLGCGLSTGSALVGNLGTDNRDHFTAIGPHVNLASRIENTAKKGEIKFSASTHTRVKSRFNCIKTGTQSSLKNIDGDHDIFEIALDTEQT
ncbi:adenylate/guanylate cyclase domain-containing response regulator [Fibrella aquatilis]|uniref:Adenylate/guanylate cyclase domain-containing response regulator n=1 Tax=Fibrella aquatilis TaxID=2817059 RepID=A0A939K354_9BACT|nr:adenylate/guanylate cyclase domain-containing response regulator [Fibrella aquatilis]MBO0934781.1 adenylate/guanylate cyclase domain-containing response regulator [Fibrella aquatilis]